MNDEPLPPEDMHKLLLLVANVSIYGDFAKILTEMKRQGWTHNSAHYVLEKVFWE